MGVQFLPVFHSFSPKVPKSINFQLPTASTFHRNVLLGSPRASSLGLGNSTFRSMRPGRSRASSRMSIRFVASAWPRHIGARDGDKCMVYLWIIITTIIIIIAVIYVHIHAHLYVCIYTHLLCVYIYINCVCIQRKREREIDRCVYVYT
jgi:hypothetical protein